MRLDIKDPIQACPGEGRGEAGGAKHGDEDLHRHDLPTGQARGQKAHGVDVDHLGGAAGEIDEHPLAIASTVVVEILGRREVVIGRVR